MFAGANTHLYFFMLYGLGLQLAEQDDPFGHTQLIGRRLSMAGLDDQGSTIQIL